MAGEKEDRSLIVRIQNVSVFVYAIKWLNVKKSINTRARTVKWRVCTCHVTNMHFPGLAFWLRLDFSLGLENFIKMLQI